MFSVNGDSPSLGVFSPYLPALAIAVNRDARLGFSA
jgi:hypothetical protein